MKTPRPNSRILNRRCLTTLLACLVVPLTLAQAAAGDRPPNVILIFVDDMGYGDIGPFGATKHATPRLDKMAKEGMKLTSFYVTSGVCTPSRCSLMTGCYPKRVTMDTNGEGKWVLFPGNHRGLHSRERILPEVLRSRGYATGIIGKWHLGDQLEFLPTRHGFDEYFGIPFSNDMGKWKPSKGYPPLPLMRNEKVIETEPNQAFLTQRYTEEALSFIRRHQEQPFFLYLPHTMTHNPLYASPAFKGRSRNGVYGDAVQEIDWSTGRILDTVKELGLEEDTLVIFTTDNGAAPPYGGSNLPLRGFKGSTWEGGMRVPFVARWKGRIPAGAESAELVTSMDLLPTLARLADAKPPADRLIDGKDVWPILAGTPDALSPHKTFFYYFMGYLDAVRSGKWKLHVARRPQGRGIKYSKPIPIELYDLESDIGEKKNVAGQRPKVVKRLRGLLAAARKDLGDDLTKTKGENTREAGWVENPKPLTHDAQGVRSITDLFNIDAPLKASQAPFTRKESTTVSSRFFPERKMRKIEVRMTSQTYRGVKCGHDTTIYLPDRNGPKESQGTAAIILGGGGIRVEDAKLDWLESIVLGLEVPCVVVQQAFIAKQFGARNAGELMSFGSRRYMETGDPREAGYYALAKIFSAAATVAEQLPEVRAKRFIVTGSSKGGMAALIACVGDPRIIGAYPTAWNSGDILGYTRLKGERWGWNVKPKQTGPAGQTARQSMAMLDSPRGRKYLELFDPAEWGDLLRDKFIMPAVGANDPLFHLLSDSNYFDQLKARKAFLRVPNYGHGRKHAQHAQGWRTAVAAALLGRKVPTIQLIAKSEGEQVALTAQVGDHRGDVQLLLWRTTDTTGDYRKAKWTRLKRIKLAGESSRIQLAHVSAPKTGTAAFFLQLEDSSDEPILINCSNVIELGKPVIQRRQTNNQ